jgi:hypothetical protein
MSPSRGRAATPAANPRLRDAQDSGPKRVGGLLNMKIDFIFIWALLRRGPES